MPQTLITLAALQNSLNETYKATSADDAYLVTDNMLKTLGKPLQHVTSICCPRLCVVLNIYSTPQPIYEHTV